jgi:hypothetical protein
MWLALARKGGEIERVSQEDIEIAFEAGFCRLVCGRGENRTSTYISLTGEDWDTRGQCFSMWEESWTVEPKSLTQVLFIAHAATGDGMGGNVNQRCTG